MNYLELRETFLSQICFSTNQVYALEANFNKNNLTAWCQKGYLIKLKNGMYSFSEHLTNPAYAYLVANKIYRPSYISLHSALAFYGLIPEAVIQITSVSALKTNNFENRFGSFSYKSMLPELMFGYLQKPIDSNLSFLLASPEKSILDLLYLYTFYNSTSEIEALRIDPEIFEEIINVETLKSYSLKFQNSSLEKRLNLLLQYMNV